MTGLERTLRIQMQSVKRSTVRGRQPERRHVTRAPLSSHGLLKEPRLRGLCSNSACAVGRTGLVTTETTSAWIGLNQDYRVALYTETALRLRDMVPGFKVALKSRYFIRFRDNLDNHNLVMLLGSMY